MRKAGQIWDKTKDIYSSELGQDIIETSIKASIAAAGQASLTDMTPEEIAIATAIGATAAMGVRPLGKRAGNYIGRKWDRAMAQPGERKSYEVMNEFIDKGKAKVNDIPLAREGLDVLQRRLFANYADEKGVMRGDMEGAIGELLRETSDDVAQGTLAFAFPALFNRPEIGEEDQ